MLGIPPGPAGHEQVKVRFSYDMNGVLDVDATIVSTQVTATFTLQSTPGRLSPSAIEEARTRLKHLKFHPREALPNVTALARADALFVELTGHARSHLAAYIAALRLAIEQQNSPQIKASREALLREIAELDARRR